jgi:hypothetical protein
VAGSYVIEGIPASLVDKLVDELTLTASLDNIDGLIDVLQTYRDIGLSSVSLRLYELPSKSMQMLAKSVLPALT